MTNYLIAFFAFAAHLIGYNNFFSIFILFFILFLYFFQNFKQFNTRSPEFILPFVLVVIGLLGLVSISLTITLISSILLWKDKRLRPFLIAGLILELPLVSSIEGYLFNKLAFVNASYLSPLIVITFFLGLFHSSYLYLGKCLLAILLTFFGLRYLSVSLTTQDLLLLLPLIYLFLSAPSVSKPERSNLSYKDHFKIALAVVFIITGFHSLAFYPKLNSSYYYYLPDVNNSYEAKFFINYDEALSYTGKKFSRIQSLNEVPVGSIVLFPWITEDDPKIDVKTIRDTALKKNLTLILVGEHTNYSNNARIINSITNRVSLNSDLTVPDLNKDESGHLRTPDFREWPASSIFNRGASVNLNILDLLLLSGDHWWLEKDIGEWLWVGDFIRQSDDRFGRVPLGMSFVEGGARFVIYGDTSPFMNFQLIANPTAFNRLLDLATCKFSFLKSLVLLISILIYLRHPKRKFLFFTSLIIIFLICYFVSYKNSSRWINIYTNQSGFNPNNFNKKLAEFKELNVINITRSRYINSDSIYSDENSIHFGLINGELILNDVTISQCRRMGLVDTGEFILMDGQNCQVSGNAELLGGSYSSAPGIKINYHGFTKVIVFDVGFLSELAPEKNVSWLLSHFKK